MTQYVPLAEARHLPFWRRPITLLFLVAGALPIAFVTWSALLNNFVIEVAQFNGPDIGWLHTMREIMREISGYMAAGVTGVSPLLALLIPCYLLPGNETTLTRFAVIPAQ